jgi:hypothetical protein
MPVMRARQLIQRPKVLIKAGDWKAGKMTRNAFPMSRTRNFQLGVRWIWRVDVLEIDGTECRLLTAFEPSKNGFLAWLSYRRGDSYTMVARLEFHGSEPGLHCHASCDDLHNVQTGVVKPYPSVRLPNARAKHRRDRCGITEASALATSFGFFRVTMTPNGAML